jgi:hypothetical protein
MVLKSSCGYTNFHQVKVNCRANLFATRKLLLDNYSAHASRLQSNRIASWLQIEIDAGSAGPRCTIWGLTLRRRIHTLPLFFLLSCTRCVGINFYYICFYAALLVASLSCGSVGRLVPVSSRALSPSSLQPALRDR